MTHDPPWDGWATKPPRNHISRSVSQGPALSKVTDHHRSSLTASRCLGLRIPRTDPRMTAKPLPSESIDGSSYTLTILPSSSM